MPSVNMNPRQKGELEEKFEHPGRLCSVLGKYLKNDDKKDKFLMLLCVKEKEEGKCYMIFLEPCSGRKYKRESYIIKINK